MDIKAGLSWRLEKLGNWLTNKRDAFFLILDNLISKSDDVWAFPVCYLNGQLFDNSRAIFEKVKDDVRIQKVILYRGICPTLSGQNISLVKLYSLKGLWSLFRAKVIFVRHCLEQDIGFKLINEKHLIVNVWHGQPLKRIGVQNIANSITGLSPLGAILCSSSTDQLTMIDSFVYANESNAWVTGLPRTDLLFEDKSTLWQDVRRELSLIEERLDGKKLILFAPTFRATWENWENTNSYYQFSNKELERLAEVANQLDAKVGIRTHLREERSVLEAFKGIDVIILNDIVETSAVLRMTDILVTDYSGIVFDYLLTGRPVLSFAYDYGTYLEGKGFLYSIEDIFPYPVCHTFDELICGLLEANENANSQEYVKRYKMIQDTFHYYQNGSSAERVIEQINTQLNRSAL